MDGAGYFQRLSQLLLPWHWDTAPHPPPREFVPFPGVTGTPGRLFGASGLPAHPRASPGWEREEGGVRKLYPPFPAESLPDVRLPVLAFITPLGHGTQHRTRGTGVPRGVCRQIPPQPLHSLTLEWRCFFFPPIVPRFGANPQHRPSCDSGMGGRSSCVPGVTLHQHPLPEPPQLCLSLSLSPLAQPRRCCR